MKDKKFLDEEINLISEFVIKAKEIPVVEAVYCVPYIETKTNKEICDIVIVYNLGYLYLKKLPKVEGKEIDLKLAMQEINKITNLCEEYKLKIENDAITFCKEDAGRYGATQMNNCDLAAKKDLISGKLIFDRFGDIKQQQVNIVKFWDIEAYTNLSDIENLEEVKQQIKK